MAALTEAVHNDCASTVHSGKSFYLSELEKGRKLFRRLWLASSDGDKAAVEAIQSQERQVVTISISTSAFNY